MQSIKLWSYKRHVQLMVLVITCTTFAYLIWNRRQATNLIRFRITEGGHVAMTPLTTAATRDLDREQGFQLMQGLVRHGLLDFGTVSMIKVADPWLTALDKEILMDDPLQDLTEVASPDTSQMHVILPSSGRPLAVGDHVTVRVDLRDEAGRAVLRGGAEVRMWAVQKTAAHRRLWKAVAVDVKDLRNGSYVTSLPVLWGGSVQVRAALLRPREFRRVVLWLMDSMKMMNQILATFSSGATEEMTLCSFLPVIPGVSDVCNLTSQNSGLPWYCGQPTKPGLTCGDWEWSTNTAFPQRYPLSPADQTLMDRFSERYRALFRINDTVTLTARDTGVLQLKRNDICSNKTAPRDTWTDQSPRGYWDNGQWRPLDCNLLPLNRSLVGRCLQNTNLLLLGDSNAKQIIHVLHRPAQCKNDLDPDTDLHPDHHLPLHFRCARGLRLSWFPHAYPFYSGIHAWSAARAKHAPSYVMDQIPSTGNYVIVIHLYLHFSPVHTSVYALHVRDTARAVARLLQRNPRVNVFVRGPHAVAGNEFRLTGDYHAERCLRVLKHEFRDLMDQVTFLNTWDMTVANENFDIHPSQETVRAIAKIMLSKICTPEHS